MSARDFFLLFGDYLWDFFCSPVSGYVVAFASLALIGYCVFVFIFSLSKDLRHDRANPDNCRKRGENDGS